MSLLNRIRPKWQNSDPDVRAAAVRELDKDDVELLTAVAQGDDDPRVRRIAIKKLDAPRVLLAIADEDGDESIRGYAEQRANQLLVQIAVDDRDVEESKRALDLLKSSAQIAQIADQAHFPELKELAMARIEGDDAALGEYVRRSRSKKKRRGAFEAITDQSVLRELALDPKLADLALSAVDRIEDVDVLEALGAMPAASKAVRRHARARLETLIDDDHPIRVRERESRFKELASRAEELAAALSIEPTDWSAVETEWNALSELGGMPSAADQRFRDAREQIDSRINKSTRATTDAPKEESPTAETAGAAPEEPASAGEDSTEAAAPFDLSAVSPAHHFILTDLGGSEGKAIAAAIEHASATWSSLAPIDDAALMEQAQAAFSAEVESAESRFAKWEQSQEESSRRLELLSSAEELLSEEASNLSRSIGVFRRLESSWNKLTAAPEDDDAKSLAERFEAVRTELQSHQAEAEKQRLELEKKNFETLDGHCKRIEEFLGSEGLTLKKATDELRMAQDFLKDMGPLPAGVSRKKQRQRLRDLREKLFLRVQDARENDDWKRWANADIQKSLIEKLEKLRASRDYPKVAKELRQAHMDWRKAATAPDENADELWQSYKSIRDELTAKCNEFFKLQDAQRTENLTKKVALCEQAESLKDSEEWNKTADALKALQTEWKKVGPVPHKQSDAIWSRFRAACNHFFERRKEVLDAKQAVFKDNLAKKIALCEQAEAVKDSTEWNATANELKKLQADWKTIGPVPHKKSESVWKRFRKACDHFFDRFKRRDEIGLEENLTKAEAIIASLGDEALGSSEPDQAATVALTQWEAFRALGPLPSSRGSEIWLAVQERMSLWLEKAGDAEPLGGTELSPGAAAKKREKLCQRLDKLVKDYQQADAGDSPDDLDDLATRLKNALASNTIAGRSEGRKSLDWKEGAGQLQRLQQAFLRSPPVRQSVLAGLRARFDAAAADFAARRKASQKQKG